MRNGAKLDINIDEETTSYKIFNSVMFSENEHYSEDTFTIITSKTINKMYCRFYTGVVDKEYFKLVTTFVDNEVPKSVLETSDKMYKIIVSLKTNDAGYLEIEKNANGDYKLDVKTIKNSFESSLLDIKNLAINLEIFFS